MYTKFSYFKLYIMIFILGISLSGCQTTNAVNLEVETFENLSDSRTPTIEKVVNPETTLTIEPKNIIVTKTASSTRTLETNTPVPINPIITQTYSPSLSKEKASEQILADLESPVCKLPCFLNIRPKITSIDDARRTLINLNSNYSEEEKEGVFKRELFSTLDLGDQTKVHYGLVLASINDYLVDGMFISINVEDNKKEIQKFGGKYDIPLLFQEYGRPEDIQVYANDEVFDLWIFYKQFIVIYKGFSNDEMESYQICPLFKSNRIISVQIYILGKDDDPRNWIKEDYLYRDSYLRDVYTATDLSIDDFFAKYLTIDKDVCFNTPENLYYH